MFDLVPLSSMSLVPRVTVYWVWQDAVATVPSSASMEAKESLYSHVWRQLTSNLEEKQTRRVLLVCGCSGSGN